MNKEEILRELAGCILDTSVLMVAHGEFDKAGRVRILKPIELVQDAPELSEYGEPVEKFIGLLLMAWEGSGVPVSKISDVSSLYSKNGTQRAESNREALTRMTEDPKMKMAMLKFAAIQFAVLDLCFDRLEGILDSGNAEDRASVKGFFEQEVASGTTVMDGIMLRIANHQIKPE